MEKEKCEETFLEKDVAMKAIISSVVDLERKVICLGTDKSCLMNTDENSLFRLLQTTISGGQITDKVLRNNSPVYLGLAHNAEKQF